MIRELLMEDLSLWGCILQSTLFAGAGLVGSFLMRGRPVRASQVLLFAIAASVTVPVMSTLVKHFEMGAFVSEPAVTEPKTPAATPVAETTEAIEYEVPEALPATNIANKPPTVAGESTMAAARTKGIHIPWRNVVLYAWMAVTLMLLLRLFGALVRGACLLRRSEYCDDEQVQQSADCARTKLGIARQLRIRSSDDVRSPIIWCWSAKPVLLVPRNLNLRIDWIGVICHELAHWRRADHINGLIAELAVCVLPWNLLLWWSKRRMVRLSEQACDDWVLASGQAGTEYAQSLLNMSPEIQMAFVPTVIGKEKPMKERISRIVKEKYSDPRAGIRWTLVVSIITVSLIVGAAFAQKRPANSAGFDPDIKPAKEKQQPGTELKDSAKELEVQIAQIREKLMYLEQNGEGKGEQAHQLRNELQKLNEQMADLKRELHGIHSEQKRPNAKLRPVKEQSFDDFRPRKLPSDGLEHPKNDKHMRELSENLHDLEKAVQGRESTLIRLKEQGEGDTDQAHAIRREMQELHERIQAVSEELATLKRTGPAIADVRNKREAQPQIEMMMQKRDNLIQKIRDIESELKRIGSDNPELSDKLQNELRITHDKLEQIKHERERLETKIPRTDTQRKAPATDRRRQLMSRREQLQVQMQEIELQLRELDKQNNKEVGVLPAPRKQPAVERSFEVMSRPKLEQIGENDMERRVYELTGQVDRLNEQMQEIKNLMNQLLQGGRQDLQKLP